MRHIYVKTPDGLGKLSFFDPTAYQGCWYMVEHYRNGFLLYTGEYKGRTLVNAQVYRKGEFEYLHKRPLIDLITKRKKG